jgi:uncharacterized protein
MPLVSLSLLVAAAFGAGLVDSIAGGGGLVTFPALVAAGLPPHLALGTNKGQAVFGATTSAVRYARGNGLDRERVPLALVAGALGSVLGAVALLAVRPEPLRPVIIVLLAIAAAVVVAKSRVVPRSRRPSHPRAALAAIAVVLGAYDGFFGPGVGSMLIVAFMLTFGDAITRASGNAKVVNLASNVAAVAVFTWRGTILWRLALPMAAANAVGAAVGTHLALRNGDRFVRWVVLMVVIAAMAKLAVDFVG